MSNKSTRLVAAFAALLVSVGLAQDATAQCCGQAVTSYYAPAYTSYYAPAYTSYYAPSAYTTNYSGWYPGYWWNRASARLFGSTTYVASYAPAYTASYAPTCSTCTAGYAPTCSTCTASYAPSCSTCSSTYTTSYAPACGCETCGSSCPSSCGCSSCSAAPTVTQASYQQPAAPCSTCSASAPQSTPTAAPQPPSTFVQPQAPSVPPSTPAAPANTAGAAASPAGTDTPGAAAGSTTVQRPAEDPAAVQPQPQPPEADNNSTDPYEVKKKDGSTYFEAPKLFNPNDRTAKRAVLAPVHTAVYHQSVNYNKTSASVPRATTVAAKPQQDVITWSSASSK